MNNANLPRTSAYELDDMNNALATLQKGGVILYPTDTVWGIGCDATNANAVQRVYNIKHRCDAKSMLILVDSAARIPSYVREVPDMAWELIDITTKPLTIIYPRAKNLAPNLLAEDGSIGIRVTDELFSKTLCARFRRPIVSTSANISGCPTAASFARIDDEIKQAVDYVVRYRRQETTLPQPSSIIKLDIGNIIQIIRQ